MARSRNRGPVAVRMKDIAELLSASVVTVSKALRNHPDIADTTRQLILDKAEELHYRPNMLARSLVTGRSSLIGMIVPDLVHSFFAEIAKSLSAELRSQGLFLIVCSSEGDPVVEQAEIEKMLALSLDVLIVASSQRSCHQLVQVNASGPPLIMIDRTVTGLSSHFVGSDDVRVGTLATEHLMSLGKTRIAHIRGPENNVGAGRLNGYLDTLARHGHSYCEQYVVMPSGELDTKGQMRGSKAMTELLALGSPPDAVFCFNDLIAVGAMTCALEAGIRIPEEIAFIGCGNYYYSRVLQVPLSSIDQQVDEFGKTLADIVLKLTKEEGVHRPKNILLQATLVIRRSTTQDVPTAARTGCRENTRKSKR